MKRIKKLIRIALYTGVAGAVFGVIAVVGLYYYISPNLPAAETLKDVRFQVPLRIYTVDGKLMAEYGEKRRSPLRYDEIPNHMVNAILGAEDDRFFEHPGVDYQGLVRAVGLLLLTGEKVQGGSTITMQVARNFFLSREKTYLRKFSEIVLALKIEEELTKQEILELYLNKIYLGNRSYGVAAASKIYYGKPIDELSIAQLAMIAGLPKAPSRYNPIVNPERALLRRNYVLRRMHDLGYITTNQYEESLAEPVTAELHQQQPEIEAPYAAEMVRQEMYDRYGSDAYTEGYRVITTVDSRLQNQANRSLRYNLLAYEERHGYRGPEAQIDLFEHSDFADWDKALASRPDVPLLKAGIVLAVDENDAYVYMGDGYVANLCWKGIRWAAPYTDGNRTGPKPKNALEVLSEGDVIRLYDAGGGRWSLGQIPEVSGALVSLRSKDGSIISIVGGYDFFASKFNRAEQAERQPGSNFKPFVYSGALEKGYTAATLINDAPVVFDDPGLENTWRPENYSGKFFGPTRLREALVKSRNLVSIRILRSIGVPYALNYVKNFGFDPKQLPHDLSLALGSASVTPLQIARGYAVFSNGGYLIDPYLIKEIVGPEGDTLYKANPPTVCEDCELPQEEEQIEEPALMTAQVDEGQPKELMLVSELEEQAAKEEEEKVEINRAKRVLTPENVYIMTTIMREIIQRGTGRRAKVLRRSDLAGKTGTTNDQRDAWFSGFNGETVTTAWVGFDKPHPLGDRESGARAALPMWITFMREALKGTPETPLVQPPGIVSMRIDPKTGLLAGAQVPNAIFEVFREGHAPKRSVTAEEVPTSEEIDSGGDIPTLF